MAYIHWPGTIGADLAKPRVRQNKEQFLTPASILLFTADIEYRVTKEPITTALGLLPGLIVRMCRLLPPENLRAPITYRLSGYCLFHKTIDPVQCDWDVNPCRIANATTIGIGDIGVDSESRIGSTQKVWTS